MKKQIGIALLTAMAIALWSVLWPEPAVSTLSSAAMPSYGQALMQFHASDRPIASAAVDPDPRVPVSGEWVTYATVAGTPVQGYLARPETVLDNGTKPLPGLIVIHEWWGLNDNIQAMTRRLAGEGYVALAVDLHGGDVAETPEQARALVEQVGADPTVAQDNLRQAYAYLQSEQGSPAIGAIGWCFGGSWALNTALLLPDQLDAIVIYYGGQLVLDPEKLDALEMPILGIFGSLDQNPSMETVLEFANVLHSLEKEAEIHIYDGADHAFANPSGTRYNPQAAADAWERTRDFLNQHLQ